MEKINSFEWFEQLLGFTEKKWNYKMETLPNFVLEQAGNFETKSIKELKENINLTNKEKIKPLRFIFRKKKQKRMKDFLIHLNYNTMHKRVLYFKLHQILIVWNSAVNLEVHSVVNILHN
jgi:hypothetical protein